jgi:hypothetical protein
VKRSEMVKLMLKFERESQEYKCGKRFMDNLLKKMEEAGMLPPAIKSKFIDGYGNIIEDYEWDEEDEE